MPTGQIALLVAVLSALAVCIGGLLWARDLRLLVAGLRRAMAGLTSRDDRLPLLPGNATLLREIERLGRDLAARNAQLERMRRADAAIVELLPDPLIVLDARRQVLRANHAARASFGTDIAAVLRHPELRAAIERAFADARLQGAELSLAAPVARVLHGAVVPLDPPLADGGAALVVLSDRTQERALEQMRADFVANASHELRTPLASLIGFIETLRGPAADDPAAQARFLAIMAEQGARMNRLIDDLLSLSRIELTEHQPPREAVDLAALIGRVAAGFEPRLAERRARLDLAIAANLPKVTGDADQLAQVLQNLIDNAVKYGAEAGTTHVSAALAPSGGPWPAGPGVLLSVRDEGAGIAREHIPRLTERFYRVDKARSRAVGGTGLGLAIVKHIVNRHRGRLRIESEPGKGTTVSAWLPRAEA